MTQERKDQLYDQMIAWICEHIKSDEDLFLTLHGHFGMTKEEINDHSIESLDRFFEDDCIEPDGAIEIRKKVEPVGLTLEHFIDSVRAMVDGEDKTAVLDWISFAGAMVDGDDSGSTTFEKELLEVYLPLCYVKNNFSNTALQQSLNVVTLGNEIVFGAMLFSAGYGELDVRQLADEGTLVDGYVPLATDEKSSLFIVGIVGKNDCIFIGQNENFNVALSCVERAVVFANILNKDLETILSDPSTSGMALRKITNPKLIDAVKIASTASSAFEHITVYDPESQEVVQCYTEGLTAEQRNVLFCGGESEPNDSIKQQI